MGTELLEERTEGRPLDRLSPAQSPGASTNQWAPAQNTTTEPGIAQRSNNEGLPAPNHNGPTPGAAPAQPPVNGSLANGPSRPVPPADGVSREGAPPPGPAAEKTPSADKAKKRPPKIVFMIGGVAAVLALFFGIRWYLFNRSHTGTDDAQVQGDIFSVSARVSGYLVSVPVSENQSVHKGDLLAQIDDREYRASLDQATANLESLKAASAASGEQVNVTRQTTGAGISQAAAGLRAARAQITSNETKLETARAGVSSAQVAVRSAIAGQQSALHAIAAAHAQVQSARSQYASAKAGLSAAIANQNRVVQDARRYQMLFSQGAISQQQYQSAQAEYTSANAAVDQARQAVDEAASRINQAQAGEESARSAAAQAAAAEQQARVGVLQAQDQVASAQAAIEQAQAQAGQAQAALESAQSAPAQISVTTSTARSNKAKIAQAEAAVEQARLQLSYAQLRATVDGYVSQKNVEPGQLVQPGQALMSVVPLEGTYVIANFKETQMTNLRVGEPAEIDVDAYPGKAFKGHVKSISSATGATFSLLPPENATGNFVKVVQRIPVKITIDKGTDPERLLRLGMSVNVSVDTSRQG